MQQAGPGTKQAQEGGGSTLQSGSGHLERKKYYIGSKQFAQPKILRQSEFIPDRFDPSEAAQCRETRHRRGSDQSSPCANQN